MNRLKELRTEFGLTQQKTADIAEVSKRTYIYWENEETQIKPEKAQVLADYFGISVGYLLGYSQTRYGSEQIKNAIKKNLSNSEKIDQQAFKNTVAIVEKASFLDFDIETIEELYLHNLNQEYVITLKDLIKFFKSNAEEYTELLSIVAPSDADSIISRIAKMGEYDQKTQEYIHDLEEKKEQLTGEVKELTDITQEVFYAASDLYKTDMEATIEIIDLLINGIESDSLQKEPILTALESIKGFALTIDESVKKMVEYQARYTATQIMKERLKKAVTKNT